MAEGVFVGVSSSLSSSSWKLVGGVVTERERVVSGVGSVIVCDDAMDLETDLAGRDRRRGAP